LSVRARCRVAATILLTSSTTTSAAATSPCQAIERPRALTTMRSTKCLSCIVDELKSADTGFGTAPTTLLLFAAEIALDFTNRCSLKYLQRRYILIIGSSLSSVAAMSDGHGYQEVFQSMSSQCLVLPELFYAAAIDIGPPIPPLKNKYAFLSDIVKSHGSLDLSFCYDQGVVISKPSFTVEIHSNAYLLFLIPSFISWVDMSWLFFNCHQDPVQWQPSLLSLLCLAMTDSGGVSGVSTLHILAHHSVAHVHLQTSLNIMLLNIGYLVAEVQLKGILSVMLATSIFHDYVQLSEYHEFFNLLETVKWSVARQCSSVEVLLKTVYMESVTGIVGHIILVQRKCGGLVFSLLWLPPACEQFVHWILWEIPWLFSALVN
jgi:hypothetical protein